MVKGCKSFYDNLAGCRYQQVIRLTLYYIHWLAIPAADHLSFADTGRKGVARDHGDGRIYAQAQRERHLLADLLPLGIDLAKVLRRNHDSRDRLRAVKHCPGYRPVYPGSVGRAGDEDAIGIDVAASVSVMDQRNRKLRQVNILAEQFIFLACARLNFAWRDGRNIRKF